MIPRFSELKLTVLSTCLFLCTGCGPANEASLKGESKAVPTKPEMQSVNSYGDLLKYRMQEAKEKGKGKDASKQTK
jgi:hypothetical protein